MSRTLRCRRPRDVQLLCNSAASAPRNVTLWTDSCCFAARAHLSVALFDADSEPRAEGREFRVQIVEVLPDVGQQAGGVAELPVAVAAVVGQVIAASTPRPRR